MGVFCVPSFFCLHYPDWVQWVLCLISVPYSMMLLLCLQSRCLLLWIERKRVNCWWMSFCVFFCIDPIDWVSWLLCLISMIRSMMLLLCFQSCCLLIIREREQWIVDGCLLCVFFLLSSQLRLNLVSVVFDFNDSLNDVAPVSPISLSVDEKRKERVNCWWMSLCVFFLLPSLFRLSAVSVVFDFNDSLNDVDPLSPILLSVDEKRNKKSELLMDVFCVSSFFCLHYSDWVQWVLCLISMHHLMMLLLCPQTHCLLMWWERGGKWYV